MRRHLRASAVTSAAPRVSAASSTSAIAMRSPRLAKRFAATRPMPLGAPVMTATRPLVNAGCMGTGVGRRDASAKHFRIAAAVRWSVTGAMSMMRAVFFGFAAAVFAVGCGAGIASSADDDAMTEEPAVVETVTTRSASPDPSHVDAASADSPTTCTVPELESNNVWTRASALVPGVACGTLATTTDEDWFSVVYGPGQVTLRLEAKGDALLSVGRASGTTCVPDLTNLHSFSASSNTAQQLCVRVASATKRVQSYVLFRK